MQHPLTLGLGLLALASAAHAQSFSYPDFTSTAGLNTVLQASTVGTVMRVHDQSVVSGGDNQGAVWYATPVNVAAGFDTTFEFSINGVGNGDGLAFVIQNDMVAGYNGMTGANGIGRHASACGYGLFTTSAPGESIDNSLAIEIDHFRNDNQPAANPILDPDDNHISIHTGGAGENQQIEDYSIGRAESGFLGVDLDSGAVHTLRVVYVPGTLDVFLNGNQVISAPYSFATGGTWIDPQTPVGGLDLISGTSAYVGFTASGGGNPKNHDIHSWSFDSGSPPGAFCEPANPNSTGVPVTLSASSITGGAGLHLDASGGPPNQAAYYLVSATGNSSSPVSQGILCLGGPQGRYNPAAGGALNSLGLFNAVGELVNISGTGGPSGMGFDLPVALPNPPGGSISAGSTWYFQLWYRDTNPGTVTNMSNGISVLF